MAARKKKSRKSSAASSSSRREAERLASVVFFVDRSLGRRVVAQTLREAGAQVEVHDDHFAQETTDVDWIIGAGQRGWIVLSKDEQIRRNPLEREAVQRARVRLSFLPSRDCPALRWARSLSRRCRGWCGVRCGSPDLSSSRFRAAGCSRGYSDEICDVAI